MTRSASFPLTLRLTLPALLLAVVAAACARVQGDAGPTFLSLEQLSSATYVVGDLGEVTLEQGTATIGTGDQASTVRLGQPVAQGHLEADGGSTDNQDAGVVLLHQKADGTVDTYLVPVVQRDGDPDPRAAVALGPSVAVQEVAIDSGQLRATVLDREAGKPVNVVDQRRRITIELRDGQPVVVADQRRGFGELPPTEVLPAQPVAFPAGATATAIDGTVAPGQAATYTVPVAKGQELKATLDGPPGAFLVITLNDVVAVTPNQGATTAAVPARAAGQAVVEVRNLAVTPANFRLNVDLPPAPPPTTKPAKDPADEGVIYLTFDDGPDPKNTPAILDVLARHGAKATFFVVGTQLQAHPELAARIVAEGHTLANHSWSHQSLKGASAEKWAKQVGDTQALLGSNATPCLRPPYGEIDATGRQRAAADGLEVILWTADTLDWTKPGAGAISSRIVAGARSGANILMHDGGGDRSQTIAGLDAALTKLAGDGWRYKPVCTR